MIGPPRKTGKNRNRLQRDSILQKLSRLRINLSAPAASEFATSVNVCWVWAMTPAREPAEDVPRRVPAVSELAQAVGQLAVAVQDAARMVRTNLPVLPHQQAAVDAGLAAIEAIRPGLRADVEATFTQQPALIGPAAESAAGRAAAVAAIQTTHRERLAEQARQRAQAVERQALELRARQVVRDWDELERRYSRAYWKPDEAQAVRAEMDALGKALKQDKALETLLREHGREFGVRQASQLDYELRHDETERAAQRLRRGPSLDLGR